MGGGAACACLACGRTASAALLRRCWGCLRTCLVNVLAKLSVPMWFPARRCLPADKDTLAWDQQFCQTVWRSMKDACTHCDHSCISGVSLPETAASGGSLWRGAIGDHWMDGQRCDHCRGRTNLYRTHVLRWLRCWRGNRTSSFPCWAPNHAQHGSTTTVQTLHSLHTIARLRVAHCHHVTMAARHGSCLHESKQPLLNGVSMLR